MTGRRQERVGQRHVGVSYGHDAVRTPATAERSAARPIADCEGVGFDSARQSGSGEAIERQVHTVAGGEVRIRQREVGTLDSHNHVVAAAA